MGKADILDINKDAMDILERIDSFINDIELSSEVNEGDILEVQCIN